MCAIAYQLIPLWTVVFGLFFIIIIFVCLFVFGLLHTQCCPEASLQGPRSGIPEAKREFEFPSGQFNTAE